jgi:hypothetical protein
LVQSPAGVVLRARLVGFLLVVGAGGAGLGDGRAGALASAASVTVAMVSGGIAIVVAMALVALLVPSFRTFRASRSAH